MKAQLEKMVRSLQSIKGLPMEYTLFPLQL
jgi:hypothetical protein